MKHFLLLTRPLNLLIIIFTMVAMRYGVVGGFLQASSAELGSLAGPATEQVLQQVPGNRFTHGFPELSFWLLVASTVLIAAGGNVINDYFDTRTDRINKPDRVIVGRAVKRRVAMLGHWALTGTGVVLGGFVAWRSGQLHLVLIPLFASGALWWYSVKFKRTFLLGNGLVALLVALVPLTVGLYEVPALYARYGHAGTSDTVIHGQLVEITFRFADLWPWFWGFAGFAFLSTLIRELQKDMADVPGDRADDCRTIPIVLGPRWAKAITMTYMAALIIALLVLRSTVLTDEFSYYYIGAGLVIPLLLSAVFTYQASNRKGFILGGAMMKLAMAIAIGFAFFINHTL